MNLATGRNTHLPTRRGVTVSPFSVILPHLDERRSDGEKSLIALKEKRVLPPSEPASSLLPWKSCHGGWSDSCPEKTVNISTRIVPLRVS
jgi:hypothetical protein